MASMERGGEVASVLRQDSKLSARCERLVCASLEWGRQMVELRIVPAESAQEEPHIQGVLM